MTYHRILIATALFGANLLAPLSSASAELVVNQIVLELQPGKQARQDVEVWNSGTDLTYVAVEPREIVGAGTPAEAGRATPDPEQLGLLVSPARLILEPGQRKLIRVAAIGTASVRERVYRVTVRPVVGELTSNQSGLKILVGYDVLVLVRPATPHPQLTGTRSGNELILKNEGNMSIELTEGKHCDQSGKSCEPLPGGRLYAGAEKKVAVSPHRRAHYVLKTPGRLVPRQF